MKHTPGPWFTSPRISPYIVIYANNYGEIAELYDSSSGTGKANATLISAAPDLLAALELGVQETMDYIQRTHLSGSENNQWLVMARTAIAKAKGEG